jgi:hypothetical protein
VNELSPFRSEASSPNSFRRYLYIVGIFVLVWPLIYGLVAWIIYMRNDPRPGLWLAVSVVASYLFCIPAALLAGIVHAVAALRFHHNSALVPIVIAPGAAFLAGLTVYPALPSLTDLMTSGFVLSVFGSLVASLSCWLLTRRRASMT